MVHGAIQRRPEVETCVFFWGEGGGLVAQFFFEEILNNISSFYYDLNIYRKDTIEKKSLVECEKQINQLKSFAKPLYLGGGINIDNIKEAIRTISPHGIDISTGLKQSNSVDEEKLKKILDNLGFDEIS